MGSTRLPGKVLADLGGRPLLVFLLERLALMEIDHLVVATTDLTRDDAVAAAARDAGAEVVRGSEDDVLTRFASVLDAFPVDEVVRLTADCPFTDPAVVIDALALRRRTGVDYASNTLVRTFPDGLDVEVVTASALLEAAVQARDRAEREHVTPFVYRRPNRFRLAALRTSELLGEERWTVDTADDLARVRGVVAALESPTTASWHEILRTAGRRAVPEAGSLRLRPAVAADRVVAAALALDVAAGPLGAAAGDLRSWHPEDPSSRAWVAELDGTVVAWALVEVNDGVGRLDGVALAPHRNGVLAAVRGALTADHQVRELIA